MFIGPVEGGILLEVTDMYNGTNKIKLTCPNNCKDGKVVLFTSVKECKTCNGLGFIWVDGKPETEINNSVNPPPFYNGMDYNSCYDDSDPLWAQTWQDYYMKRDDDV